MTEMSIFAKTIMEQKYSHTKKDGTKETWEEIAKRVTKNVMKAVGADLKLSKEIEKMIIERKFIPGGRYLYASGRPYHQVQNCLLLKAEDSREGWSELLQKASMALMTGAGIGVDYSDVRAEGKPIRKTGGNATGPIALMQMLNECGRGIMQGGSRRSAIWAGLNWKHADIHKFIMIKNWSEDVKKMKAKDFNFPATLDGTNISVQLDDDFFKAYQDDEHPLHAHAHSVYWATVKQMLSTGEPGFSIDTGVNSKETLRNACVTGDTEILTSEGYKKIEDVVDQEVNVWNGFEWSSVTPKVTGKNQEIVRVEFSSGQSLFCTKNHKFVTSLDYVGNSERVDAKDLQIGDKLIKANYPVLDNMNDVAYAYSQGFFSAEGMDNYNFLWVYYPKHMCLKRFNSSYVKDEVKYERYKVGLNFDPQPKNFVPFNWSLDSKLNWLAGLIDGDGTELKEGGCQIGSINKQFLLDTQKLLTTMGVSSKVTLGTKAGSRLLPNHKDGNSLYDCQDFYRLLIGATQIQFLKDNGLKCERMLFGKSPNRDASQFIKVVSVEDFGIADTVYCFTEPKRNLGCFNGIVTGQCTEITSADDSDICNLGSINMANITDINDMANVVRLSTAFLLAGTVYSDVPYAKVDQTRTKNRRLGVGLMGLHEWLLLRGKKYGFDAELDSYMFQYSLTSKYAEDFAKQWDLSVPVKTRAIAPTGSIGIMAETTTGIEPIFCVAYKRRYLKHMTWHYQYVLDPTAKRLIEEKGVNPDLIEDAYSLAENVERRLEFQAWLQNYVDHAISSTINLPSWGSELNNEQTVQSFGNMLMKYLPKLRGITGYPDGARGGQPLSPVKYQTAIKHVGEIFVENTDICDITKGGSCGS